MNTFNHFSTLTLAAFVCLYAVQHNLVDGASLADELPGLLAAQDTCRSKSGVSDKVYEDALNQKMDGNDKNLQCYTKCMLEEMKGIDAKGVINLKPLLDKLGQENKDTFSDIVITCQEKVDDPDLCVKGMKLYQCAQDIAKDKFIFV